MAVYINSSALLQTFIALVDITFFFLYAAIILCFSVIDSRITQSAYLFSSISGMYETFAGETKRFFLRRSTKHREQVPLISHIPPQSNNSRGSDDEDAPNQSPSQNNSPHLLGNYLQSDFTSNKLETRETTQPVYNQKRIEMTRAFNIYQFLIFWIVLFMANYVSTLVNIGLGYSSKPTPDLMQLNLTSSGVNYPQWYLDLPGPNKTSTPNNRFYDPQGDYKNSDIYDSTHSLDIFNDTLNAKSQNLLGTSVFQYDYFTCSLFDNAASYILNSGPMAISILKARPFSPSLDCSSFVNGNSTQYAAYPYLSDSASENYVYGDGNENQIFIGDNVTVFAVDRANKTTTAMTLSVLDHQVKMLRFGEIDQKQAWADYYNWINVLLNSTAFPLPSPNDDGFLSQFMYNKFSDTYLSVRSLNGLFKAMNIAMINNYPFVSIFSLQRKFRPGYLQIIRFTISYNNGGYNNPHQVAVGVLNYTTQTTRYNIVPKIPTNFDPNSSYRNDFPLTQFAHNGTYFLYPVLFTQPILNIKPLVVAASGLARFANYTMADTDVLNMTYDYPIGIRYNITFILSAMVFITGLSVILIVVAWLAKGGHFVRIPHYYDFLHEHYQNGMDCTASISTISKPLYSGHTFLNDKEINYLGITDSVYLREKPRKGYGYN